MRAAPERNIFKLTHYPHAAPLATTADTEADLAQASPALDQHAAFRIGGHHIDRVVALLVRHPPSGPRDEGRSLDDGDDRGHGA